MAPPTSPSTRTSPTARKSHPVPKNAASPSNAHTPKCESSSKGGLTSEQLTTMKEEHAVNSKSVSPELQEHMKAALDLQKVASVLVKTDAKKSEEDLKYWNTKPEYLGTCRQAVDAYVGAAMALKPRPSRFDNFITVLRQVDDGLVVANSFGVEGDRLEISQLGWHLFAQSLQDFLTFVHRYRECNPDEIAITVNWPPEYAYDWWDENMDTLRTQCVPKIWPSERLGPNVEATVQALRARAENSKRILGVFFPPPNTP